MRSRKILVGLAITIPLVLLSIASWIYIKKTADPMIMELTLMAPRLTSSPYADPKYFLEKLRAVNIEQKEIPKATLFLTRLITLERTVKQPLPPKAPSAPRPYWTEYKERAPQSVKSRMNQWESLEALSPLTSFVYDLFEKDYGKTRTTLAFLLNHKSRLPDLELLLTRAIFEKTGKELPATYFEPPSEESKALVLNLLADDSMLAWAKSKKGQLKQFAGNTHTIIGIYDWMKRPEYAAKIGFNSFPKTADAYYDYGGGFATPDIDRLLRKTFTSVDILPPTAAHKLNVRFSVLKDWKMPDLTPRSLRPQTEAEHNAYMSQLDQVPFLNFDIFNGHLPTDSQSYFIVSFGFLSSPIASLSPFAPYEKVPQIPKRLVTTYFAARRILELVALGKDVDLLTYDRASNRPYLLRTIFLSFRNHHLVKEMIVAVDTKSPPGHLIR